MSGRIRPACRGDLLAWSQGGFAIALILMVAGCEQQLPTVAASAVPAVPSGQARIWFYRDLRQSAIPEVPYVRINGTIAGTAYQGEAFYRDIPPGRYRVTVDSMANDVNQPADVSLSGGGQDAYIKVEQLDNWDEDDWGEPNFATFYARLMPPALGRSEVQASHFHGGGSLAAPP